MRIIDANGVQIDNATQVGTLEVGHASDTTISRVSAGVIAVEGVTIPTVSSTNKFTNKRNAKRVTSETSSATPTINTDNCDVHRITALAVNITSMTTNLTGTPDLWDLLAIEIIGTATRTIAWGASFSNGGLVNLPTTTVGTTPLKVLLQYNGSTWSCLAVA